MRSPLMDDLDDAPLDFASVLAEIREEISTYEAASEKKRKNLRKAEAPETPKPKTRRGGKNRKKGGGEAAAEAVEGGEAAAEDEAPPPAPPPAAPLVVEELSGDKGKKKKKKGEGGGEAVDEDALLEAAIAEASAAKANLTVAKSSDDERREELKRRLREQRQANRTGKAPPDRGLVVPSTPEDSPPPEGVNFDKAVRSLYNANMLKTKSQVRQFVGMMTQMLEEAEMNLDGEAMLKLFTIFAGKINAHHQAARAEPFFHERLFKIVESVRKDEGGECVYRPWPLLQFQELASAEPDKEDMGEHAEVLIAKRAELRALVSSGTINPTRFLIEWELAKAAVGGSDTGLANKGCMRKVNVVCGAIVASMSDLAEVTRVFTEEQSLMQDLTLVEIFDSRIAATSLSERPAEGGEAVIAALITAALTGHCMLKAALIACS